MNKVVAFLELSGLKLPCFAWFCIYLHYFVRNSIVNISEFDDFVQNYMDFMTDWRFLFFVLLLKQEEDGGGDASAFLRVCCYEEIVFSFVIH